MTSFRILATELSSGIGIFFNGISEVFKSHLMERFGKKGFITYLHYISVTYHISSYLGDCLLSIASLQ